MARAAFTTSYDEDGPIKRNNEECNEFFYEKRRREMLGDREDSEEIFRLANPTLNLPASPGGPLLPQSPGKRKDQSSGAHSGAVALYQIPKLYAGDIDQPRRLLNLPPVPEEQLKQYAELVSRLMKPTDPTIAADPSAAAVLSYQPLVGFYEKYFFEKRKLGSGGFADVFEAVDKLDGMSYAVKRIKFKSVAHFCKHYNKILREVRLLARLSHRNVLRYYSAWIEISSTTPQLSSSTGSELVRIDIKANLLASGLLAYELGPAQIFSSRGVRKTASGGYKVQEIPSSSAGGSTGGNSFGASKDAKNVETKVVGPEGPKIDSFWDKSYTMTAGNTIDTSTQASARDIASEPVDEAEHSSSDDSGLTTREDFTATLTGITKTYEVIEEDSSSLDSSSSLEDSSVDESDGFLRQAVVQDATEQREDGHAQNISAGAADSSSSSLEEIVRVPPSARNAGAVIQTARSPHQEGKNYIPPNAAETVTFTLYIKTQLYTNETLKDWLGRRQNVDSAESIRVFRQIMEALAYIHQNNICHRDIKPGNIFMGADGVVVLGDFGLAKELFEEGSPTISRMHDAEGDSYCAPCAAMADLPDGLRTPAAPGTPHQGRSDDHQSSKKSSSGVPKLNSLSVSTTPSLSRHTSRLGTAAYAAPEQIASTGDYSNRVDIFPAGIILFELLSIFSSGHERGAAINNLRKGILPTNFVAAFPIASKWIIRMTDPKPELRPTCAEVLASDLFAVVTPSPLTTRQSDSSLATPTSSATTSRALNYSSSDIDEEQLSQIKDRKLLIRIILEQQKMISELRGQLDSRDSVIQQLDSEVRQLQRSVSSKSPSAHADSD